MDKKKIIVVVVALIVALFTAFYMNKKNQETPEKEVVEKENTKVETKDNGENEEKDIMGAGFKKYDDYKKMKESISKLKEKNIYFENKKELNGDTILTSYTNIAKDLDGVQAIFLRNKKEYIGGAVEDYSYMMTKDTTYSKDATDGSIKRSTQSKEDLKTLDAKKVVTDLNKEIDQIDKDLEKFYKANEKGKTGAEKDGKYQITKSQTITENKDKSKTIVYEETYLLTEQASKDLEKKIKDEEARYTIIKSIEMNAAKTKTYAFNVDKDGKLKEIIIMYKYMQAAENVDNLDPNEYDLENSTAVTETKTIKMVKKENADNYIDGYIIENLQNAQ